MIPVGVSFLFQSQEQGCSVPVLYGFEVIQKKCREDQYIAGDLHRAETFTGDQDSHQAGGQRIDDSQNGSLFGGHVFLAERLEGKAEAAANEDQKQEKDPFLPGLRYAEIARYERGNQTEHAHRTQLDDANRDGLGIPADFFRCHDAHGIREGGKDSQDHACVAAAGAVLGEGEKADPDDGKQCTEHRDLLWQCACQDSSKNGDHDDGHVFYKRTDTGIDSTETEHFKDHTDRIEDTQDHAAAKTIPVTMQQFFVEEHGQNKKGQNKADSQDAQRRHALQQCLGKQKRSSAGNKNRDQ